MLLSKQLVERFRALHFEKYSQEISYNAAEYQLKELADLVRMTSNMENNHEGISD